MKIIMKLLGRVGWLVVMDGLATQSAGFATLAPSHYIAAVLGRETLPETAVPVAMAALLGWTALMLVAAVVKLQRSAVGLGGQG